jgi:hypothetical protein
MLKMKRYYEEEILDLLGGNEARYKKWVTHTKRRKLMPILTGKGVCYNHEDLSNFIRKQWSKLEE